MLIYLIYEQYYENCNYNTKSVSIQLSLLPASCIYGSGVFQDVTQRHFSSSICKNRVNCHLETQVLWLFRIKIE